MIWQQYEVVDQYDPTAAWSDFFKAMDGLYKKGGEIIIAHVDNTPLFSECVELAFDNQKVIQWQTPLPSFPAPLVRW